MPKGSRIKRCGSGVIARIQKSRKSYVLKLVNVTVIDILSIYNRYLTKLN